MLGCLGGWSFGRLGDCPTRMPVQRSRDVHIWRLPAKNGVSRMAIYAKLHGNYMFYIHTNGHELSTNCSQFFSSFLWVPWHFFSLPKTPRMCFSIFLFFFWSEAVFYFLFYQPRNSQMKIEYSDVGLQILILKTSGLQIPMNSWRSTVTIS